MKSGSRLVCAGKNLVVLVCLLSTVSAARDRQGHWGGPGNGKEYYGKFIGEFNMYAHKVSGFVYAVDDDTIFIKNFTYDGNGPDAFFWMGKTSQPSPSGTIIPYPVEYSGETRNPPILTNYQNEDVLLHLPDGMKIKDFKWLSVWCRRFTVNFGDVNIMPDLEPPARRVLPEFHRLAHGLRSGNITILDAKTFYIPNLHYDGAGPDAYFWVGTGKEPHPNGRKIPNERGSMDVLLGYEGEDIEITLPSDLTVMDIDWLSMWCVRYKHNFGHVMIPKNLNVPPALSHVKTRETPQKQREFPNCREFLNRKIQIKWKAVDQHIHFQVSAAIPENNYVALGFSPARGRTQMVGGDAVIMYYTPRERSKFHADDYYMTAKSQCDGNQGVCPDVRIGGKNDVIFQDGYRKNGVTTIKFRRPFRTDDAGKYDLDLDNEVNIMVAIGLLNNRKEANFHAGERTDGVEDVRIFLRGKNDHSCVGDLESLSEDTVEPWKPAIIDQVTNFTARIGPTGGNRGYTAITGQPSWGIAWWINEKLIPEIYVERGKTYHFQVEGGSDATQPAKYHPFYITDSPEGGYSQKNSKERAQQKVFAGVGFDSQDEPYPTGVGRYCEYVHKTVDKSKESETFADYLKTVRLECEDNGEPGRLTWTVELDTPDLVYYQCYTHNNLGWKIHVKDAGFNYAQISGSCRATRGISIMLASCISTFLAFIFLT